MCGIDGCRDHITDFYMEALLKRTLLEDGKQMLLRKSMVPIQPSLAWSRRRLELMILVKKTVPKHHVAMTGFTRGEVVIESDHHIPLRTVTVVLQHGKSE